MPLNVGRVDPYTLPDGLLEEYFALFHASFAVDQPYSPLPGREWMTANVRQEPRPPEQSMWFATREDRLLGYAKVSPLTGTNAAIVSVMVRVHPDHRRSGVGTALLRAVSPCLGDGGRTTVLGSADEGSAGAAWAMAHGFEVTDGTSRQLLNVAETGRRLWDVAPVPGFSLRAWTGEAPDDLLAEYAKARDAIHDRPKGASYDAPRWTADGIREDERTLREQGVEQWVTVAVAEHTGEVAGLTVLEFKAARPEIAYQRDTAVVPHHRGKRLGLWVKAAMLRRVTADRPGLTRVTTLVSTENVHMARINRELGFEDKATTLILEQSVDDVTARLLP
ncbi:hypothetical protein Afil01_42210 [Actinorhabdospora filicis]|uniref:N-acetyltransferase domain-containing protein n=1 Tax=Actinorhabdospora filicis TaxID=1785913 RepID=A0A9W6WA90_9ACTN|nr:GNAT family N-acetyltransferase [Actinorhabdospora filicis]GLZ79414.1 hypothetical protein Afil01_42210 [Actinorhabdospora filicis]